MQRHHQALGLAVASLACATATAAPAVEVRVVFRCQANGVTTFSDRPCGANAQEYELESRVDSDPPGAAAPEASRSTARDKPKAAPKSTAAADRAKHVRECERVNTTIRDIVQKMRSGYGVREGEKLRERKAKLETKRRALRC